MSDFTPSDVDREALVLRLWDEGIVRPEHFGEEVVAGVVAAGWVPAAEYRDHLGDERVEHAVALGAALNERDAALAVIERVRDLLDFEYQETGVITDLDVHISSIIRTVDTSPLAARDAETRPEVVCLCGSTRFYDEFQQANYDLTMQGKIVLSVGFYPHAKAKHGHGEGVGHNSAEKVALDELHKRKIDLANRVLVLNVGGYIGESTRSEIDYAVARGVLVEYLEPVRTLAEKGADQ